MGKQPTNPTPNPNNPRPTNPTPRPQQSPDINRDVPNKGSGRPPVRK